MRVRSLWTAIAAGLLACAVVASARELTGQELCQRLTADEVGAIVGTGRTAQAGDGKCTYAKSGVPAIRLINSPSDTRAEFIELVTALKGTVQDGPGGSVISAVAFDQQNGKISAAWFVLNKMPVELEFDRGLEIDKARALVEAALK